MLKYLQAFAAYFLWGIFPLYWKLLASVNSFEVICHRIIWSLLTLLVSISVVRQWPDISAVLRDRKRLALSIVAAILISINWLTFIWAVQNKYVVESSLGYFANPLCNVILGVFLFQEKLHPVQWFAVAVAATGVLIMAVQTGQIPWIAITLAFSFSLYAAAKKKTIMPAIAGLGMETAILMPIALAYLIYVTANGTTTATDSSLWFFLALGGPITTLPLVLFSAAAKKVPMVAMGMLQYTGPTIQFLLGKFWFGEKVEFWQMIGFECVWLALLIMSGYALAASRSKHTAVPQTSR